MMISLQLLLFFYIAAVPLTLAGSLGVFSIPATGCVLFFFQRLKTFTHSKLSFIELPLSYSMALIEPEKK